eukprot:2595904-Amphidinium_carterae.1
MGDRSRRCGSNKRRAFGRHMSAVLGRSGFDATVSGAGRSREVEVSTFLSDGQSVPASLRNSPLEIFFFFARGKTHSPLDCM